MWLWLSMMPGTTVRPPRSITLLGTQLLGLGPGPITVNLPSWIMTEDTMVLAASIVWITPFCSRTQLSGGGTVAAEKSLRYSGGVWA